MLGMTGGAGWVARGSRTAEAARLTSATKRAAPAGGPLICDCWLLRQGGFGDVGEDDFVVLDVYLDGVAGGEALFEEGL